MSNTEPKPDKKLITESKTFWANLAIIIAAIIATISYQEFPEAVVSLSAIFGLEITAAKVAGAVAILIPALNIGLRLVTGQPIDLKSAIGANEDTDTGS